MKITDVSKIKYSIKIKNTTVKRTNRKPVYGFLSITDRTARPFAFYTSENTTFGSSTLRSHVVVPTTTLMYGKIGDNTYMIPIYNLPYNLVKLIFHYIEDYNDDSTIEKLLDTRLYNPNIVCIDFSNPNTLLKNVNNQNPYFPKVRNVFHLLNEAANQIYTELSPAINNGITNNDLETLINKYGVFFIFDNVDDFNVFISFLAYSRIDSNNPSWHQHMLFVRWSPDFNRDASRPNFSLPSLRPSGSNVVTCSPFATYYTEEHIPISLFNMYNRQPAYPLSYHMRNDSDVIIWMYITSQGLGYYDTINGTPGNQFSNITKYMYRMKFGDFLPSIPDFYNFNPEDQYKNIDMKYYIYYLDYHPNNWQSSDLNIINKNILGVGFIVRSTDIGNRASFVDNTEGRFFISNTDGIFRKNHWLTAILQFLVLRKMGFRPVAAFRFNDAVSDIKTYQPTAYTQRSTSIYSTSPNLDKVRNTITKTEYKGLMFRMYHYTSSNAPQPYTLEVGLDKDSLEELPLIETSMSNHMFEKMIQNYITDLITVRMVPDFFNIFVDFMKNATINWGTSSPNLKFFSYNINIMDMEPYHSEPALITNNTDNGVYRYYYKYLSDAYSLYGHYHNNAWLYETSPTLDELISLLLTSNHPALILYDSTQFEWPMSKRNRRFKSDKILDTSSNTLVNTLLKRNIQYIQLYDYINYSDNSIINQLKKTQKELVYPLSLSDKDNFLPVILDINYMYNKSYATFVNGSLISSGDILNYPMLPDPFNPSNRLEAEINYNEGLYYREVLYHKYIRYLVLSVLYHTYYYPDIPYSTSDVLDLKISRGTKKNEQLNREELNIEISFSIRLYDNRIIKGENVELIFVI